MKTASILATACVFHFGAAASIAAVQFYVNNPGANSSDFVAACTINSLVVDRSIDFATHPLGAVNSAWFHTSSGVTITTTGTVAVESGVGSVGGNITDPDGIGEGVLPEPLRYLASGGGPLATVDFVFDRPVAAFGFMTADMFQWGEDGTPAATIEAFDSGGNLLGSSPSFDASYEFDFLYFMGVTDDAARIARVRFTNHGIHGDSIYITQAWFARAQTHCTADFNNDGIVDFFDYLDFVDAFSSGC